MIFKTKTSPLKAALLAGASFILVGSAAHAAEQREYNVPASDLKTALDKYIKQSGQQLIYRTDQVTGVSVEGIKGIFSSEVALREMLANSPFELKRDKSGAFVIKKRSQLLQLTSQREAKATARKVTTKKKQTPAPKQDTDDNDFFFDEIVVTAQKREQSLQDVPVAVSAISGHLIKQQGLLNLTDALELTPNIEIEDSALESNVIMRGVSRGAVATLMNGIAQLGGVTTFGSPIADIERVEVLRGPQGSIYGRNAAGGVINYIARAPQDTFEASLQADLGNYSYRQFSGMVNMPVVEGKVAARFNAFHEHEGGWVDNELTGEKLESGEAYGFRGQVLLTPNDTFSAKLLLQYNNNQPSSHADYYVTGSPIMDFWVAHVNANLGKNLPTIQNDAFSGKTNLDGNLGQSSKQFHTQAHLTWDTEWGTLMSITAYSDQDLEILNADTDGSALSILPSNATEDASNFSQEFRLVSNASDTFEYIVGLYYEQQKFNSVSDLNFGEDGSLVAASLFSRELAVGINQAIGAAVLPTDFTPLLDPTGFLGAWDFDQDISNVKTYAAYANATYKVTEKFHLTAGGRLSQVDDARTEIGIPTVYNFQELALPALAPFAAFLPTDFTVPGAAVQDVPIPDYKKTDWAAAVKGSYFANDDIMFYASLSRGFTPGAIQATRINSTDIQIDELDPEIIWNYEVGTKTSWLDGRLLINSSAYFIDYSNFQTLTLRDNAFQVADGGTMHNYGFELETIARPTSGLTLIAAIGYTNAKYKGAGDGEENVTGCYLGQTEAEGCVDGVQLRTGHQVERSAKWNGNVGFNYTKPLNDDWEWYLGADMTFRSSILREADFDPRSIVAPYQRVNARLGFRSDAYSIIFWVRNLTDERYTINGNRSLLVGITDGAYLVQPNQPRTYGMTLRAEF